jgi:tRNA(Phe) wybutosine-synthesizing methylase Tyw3
MSGGGYIFGRGKAAEERVDLRKHEEDDDTSVLDEKLNQALRQSKERMDRVAQKAEQLKRTLRRPHSYPQIEAAFAGKQKVG